jgi:hypothetical protein
LSLQHKLSDTNYCAAKGDYYVILKNLLHYASSSEKRKVEALVIAVMQKHLTILEALLAELFTISDCATCKDRITTSPC